MRKVYKGNFQHLVKRKQKHHRKHKVKVLQGEDAYLPMRISRHLLKMTSCLLFSNTTVLLQMYSMPPSWPIWVAMAPGWGWIRQHCRLTLWKYDCWTKRNTHNHQRVRRLPWPPCIRTVSEHKIQLIILILKRGPCLVWERGPCLVWDALRNWNSFKCSKNNIRNFHMTHILTCKDRSFKKTEFQNLELADRLGWKLWMEMRPIYISKRGFAACGTATTCSTNWKAGNRLKWFISSALQIVDETAMTCSTNWKAGKQPFRHQSQ